MAPWQALFRELIQDGVVRDIPVERITDFVSDVLYGTMFTNYFAGRKSTLVSQSKNILDMVFHGLLVRGNAAFDSLNQSSD